jgi:hypothetical protein
VVGSAAIAELGAIRPVASRRTTGTTESLRHARDDPLFSGAAPAFRGLLEATTSVLMPTSRWWWGKRRGPCSRVHGVCFVHRIWYCIYLSFAIGKPNTYL